MLRPCLPLCCHGPKICPYRAEGLFVYSRLSEQFFSYPAAVTITGDRAANIDLCLALLAFIVLHLLRHGTSVCTVSSEGQAPTSHSGIQTGDARIIRSLYFSSNHCATPAAFVQKFGSFNYLSVSCRTTVMCQNVSHGVLPAITLCFALWAFTF